MYTVTKDIAKTMVNERIVDAPQLLLYCPDCQLVQTRVLDGNSEHGCSRCGQTLKNINLPTSRIQAILRSVHGGYHNDMYIFSDAISEPGPDRRVKSNRRMHTSYIRKHPLEVGDDE